MRTMRTIDEAKRWLRDRLNEGAECPVCRQHAQLYRRKLNAGMARALIQIYRHAGLEWTRVQDIPDGPRGGDYAKLRFWGFLEPRGDKADDGNSSGWWRVTIDGQRFLLNSMTAPSHVGTYNNKTYPLTDPVAQISIQEALGDKFNYDDLLRGIARSTHVR